MWGQLKLLFFEWNCLSEIWPLTCKCILYNSILWSGVFKVWIWPVEPPRQSQPIALLHLGGYCYGIFGASILGNSGGVVSEVTWSNYFRCEVTFHIFSQCDDRVSWIFMWKVFADFVFACFCCKFWFFPCKRTGPGAFGLTAVVNALVSRSVPNALPGHPDAPGISKWAFSERQWDPKLKSHHRIWMDLIWFDIRRCKESAWTAELRP